MPKSMPKPVPKSMPKPMTVKAEVKAFFDGDSHTVSYVVADAEAGGGGGD